MENSNQSLSVAAKHLRKLKSKGADNQIIDIPVSVDGSWQKRYGFNSLLGMIFIISIDTGCVLDFITKSLFCHVCKENPNASESWKDEHKKDCMINHEDSSGAMEKEAAKEMYTRSIETT